MFGTKNLKTVAIMAALIGLAVLSTTQAKADTYTFDFTGSDGSGTATAIGTLDVVGGQALSGTGTLTITDLPVTDDTISLVTESTPGVNNLGGGNLSYRFGGGTDLIGDTTVPIDGNGLVFIDTTNVGDVGFNIWANGGASFTGFVAGDVEYDGYNGTLTLTDVSGVPEPATWAMMLIGFGMVGLQLRRRSRTAEVSA